MFETQEIFTIMGGKVKMYRGTGYQPTSDAVWLAALPHKTPGTVLDVGIGTGAVALCLHHHFPEAKITGIDISQDMLDTCARNAELNNCDLELIQQDILDWSTPRTFDLVISNPPYFKGTPKKKNSNAHHNVNLTKWTRRSVARVRPKGYFCTIVDATCAGEVLGVVGKYCREIGIIPLYGSKPVAERVLIRGRACAGGPCTIHLGYPMNYEPILRDGLTIRKILSSIKSQC